MNELVSLSHSLVKPSRLIIHANNINTNYTHSFKPIRFRIFSIKPDGVERRPEFVGDWVLG